MEQTIISGNERREKLLALLLRSDEPLSGGKIGDIYHVSRQVVVQDIERTFDLIDTAWLCVRKGCRQSELPADCEGLSHRRSGRRGIKHDR